MKPQKLIATAALALTLHASAASAADSQSTVRLVDPTNPSQERISGTLYTAQALTSGALPTVAVSSGTATQVSTTRNAHVAIPWTADATANAATFKVELSPDNSTFSTLYTASLASAVNNTGAITLASDVMVPAGWYLKVTVVHAAIGTVTYY